MNIFSRIIAKCKNDGFVKAVKDYTKALFDKMKIQEALLSIEKCLPIKKNIVLECESDMDDNPRAFYEYLLKIGYNKRHKLIWLVKNVEFCKKKYPAKNVVFLSHYDYSRRNTMKLNYYLATSKWFIFSHPSWFKKHRKEQIVVHIGHGHGFKNLDTQNVDVSSRFDWILVTSEKSSDIQLRFWRCTADKIVFGGYPRIDLFYCGDKFQIFNSLFEYRKDQKVIICMPTYKQSTRVNDSDIMERFSIPFIHNEHEIIDLNGKLSSYNTHMIIKLHPLQIKENLFLSNFSNIHYVTNDDLLSKGILLYELVGKCDALITDFSSIYTDFLVLDRPIAFLVENIRNYKRGFLVDNPEDYMPGQKISTIDDFIDFIKRIEENVDDYSEDRHKICDYFHHNNHSNNCEFFFNWLINSDTFPHQATKIDPKKAIRL